MLRLLSYLLASVVLLVASVAIARGEQTSARPNIVLIMADDFGYECVEANGGQSYRTPHLNRLAASGMRFEHCYVQPLCTPTRAQLMTGLYNVRNYVEFGKLSRTETTFAQLLKKAGYVTGICGKWQLGHEPDSPQHFGFDESYLWQHTRRPPRYANPGLEHNGREIDFSKGEYGPDLVNDFALDFVTRHRAKPFLLYYPMMLTHSPFQPTPDSPDWDPQTRGEEAKQSQKHFAEMTTYMDKLIGQLDSKLASLGIRENTLLIFLGDNGTSHVTTRFQNADYVGAKGKTVRNGMHVPLIVNWPAVVKPGRTCGDLISSVDILPTICQAAGVALPSLTDGASFLPQLKDQTAEPRAWIYSWYLGQTATNAIECAFDKHFKLYRDGRFYDVAADPHEKQSLARSSLTGPAVEAAQKLQSALDQFAEARPVELRTKRQNTKTDKPAGDAKSKNNAKSKAKKSGS